MHGIFLSELDEVLVLNLWIVSKAYLTLVKPIILISAYVDHKVLKKVTHMPVIKF